MAINQVLSLPRVLVGERNGDREQLVVALALRIPHYDIRTPTNLITPSRYLSRHDWLNAPFTTSASEPIYRDPRQLAMFVISITSAIESSHRYII
ncbi:MAG TPA: hypothetical protein V6D26_14680 [Stenomitos sp.]